MKIIFVGDPHLDSRNPLSRIDDYRDVTINKLKSLLKLCVDNSVNMVVFTGDMFHRYEVSLHYLTSVITVLNSFKSKGIELISLVGNHDLPRNLFSMFDSTPLSLLFKTGIVKPLVNYNDISLGVTIDSGGKCGIMYGIDFTRPEVIEKYDVSNVDGIKILIMHYATDNTIPGESISREKLSKFDIVVSGHDHHYYEPSGKKPLVLRPGSFTRRTRDDYNLTRNIVVYMLDTVDKSIEEFVLPGVESAELVFTTEVFMEDFENPYNANYNNLFTKHFLSETNNGAFTIREIIESLPPAVTEKTKNVLLNYLKNI